MYDSDVELRRSPSVGEAVRTEFRMNQKVQNLKHLLHGKYESYIDLFTVE